MLGALEIVVCHDRIRQAVYMKKSDNLGRKQIAFDGHGWYVCVVVEKYKKIIC